MDLQTLSNCFLFNENKEETSGVIIKSVLCLTALMINFPVFLNFD